MKSITKADAGIAMVCAFTSPALAQDKYHDTGIISPEYHSGKIIYLPPCNNKLYCRLQKLLRLLERFEIEFYFDFRLYFKVRLKPEEVMQRLSLLEKTIVLQGKMVPEIKVELDILRVMPGKV